MGTQRRMRGLSPSLVTSSIPLAILGLGTSTASGDFLNRNFLDNLFSFSGAAQSPDYPGYDDIQYSEFASSNKQEAHIEDIKKPVKDIGGDKQHVKGGVLPAYCDPPNPCPQGYTAEDGCIEASQNCMCDSEHMFSCPSVNS